MTPDVELPPLFLIHDIFVRTKIIHFTILGLFSFYATSLLFVVFALKRINKVKIKRWVIVLTTVCFLLPVVYVGSVIYKFYDIKYDRSSVNVDELTSLGHKYEFDFNRKFKENGYYVYWYICPEELEQAWNSRSSIDYNGINDKGYSISITLIRYLTSKGLKKDANGVNQLTGRDIKNIEEGIANYIYDTSVFSVYPRVYETIWELDRYLLTGNPNNKSLSQRIEYTKAALFIIKEHFWFGVGTGNSLYEYRETYKKMNSSLDEKNFRVAHNQYLSYMSKYGMTGFLYIMFILIFVVRKKRQQKNELLLIFFVYMLIANLGDSNWETHIGLSFFLFFFSLFLWNSPESLSYPDTFKNS